MEIIRYLWRRKVRTLLTMLAVTVGIFAVTAVGGITEQLESTIQMVEQDALSRITVYVTDYEQGALSDSQIRQLRQIPGVAGVTVSVMGNLEKQTGVVRISVNPAMYVGVSSDLPGLEYEPPLPGMQLESGRLPAPGNRTETVISWELAQARGLQVGDFLLIQEQPFRVVGIWEKSPTTGSRTATIAYDAAVALTEYVEYNRLIQVIPQAGADLEALAQRIETELGNLRADSPSETVAQARQQVLIFTLIVGASGILSLLIGTFTIVNTMTVSVQERRQEIGLKKALGAENGHILSEVITEALLIAGLGGLIGMLGGWVAGTLADRLAMAQLGTSLFRMTPRLAVGTVTFSGLMGVIAGVIPALQAARLDPVVALRGGSAAVYAARGFKRLIYLVRRNARSILTVVGIAIGIFTLAVLGSLAEGLNSALSSVEQGSGDLVMVYPGKAGVHFGYSTDQALRRLPCVQDVVPVSQQELPVNFSDTEVLTTEVNLGVWGNGSPTGALGFDMMVHNTLAQGRMFTPGTYNEVVVGAAVAETHHLQVGDTIRIKSRPFTVVGIWRRLSLDLFSDTNNSLYTTMEGLEAASGQKQNGSLSVRVAPGCTMTELTEAIKANFSGLEVQTIQEITGQIRQVFSGIIAVIAAIFSIAVFVGAVSVANTMIIAVNERTGEIGLKKAVGAENSDILAEMLLDAIRLGAVGAVVGLGVAGVAVAIGNAVMVAQTGISLLYFSPRLAVGAVIFGMVLGMIAGVLPARRAARLDPVVALHAE